MFLTGMNELNKNQIKRTRVHLEGVRGSMDHMAVLFGRKASQSHREPFQGQRRESCSLGESGILEN